jgi:hypothetical protein
MASQIASAKPWTPVPIFVKLYVYITSHDADSTAYFIPPAPQSALINIVASIIFYFTLILIEYLNAAI